MKKKKKKKKKEELSRQCSNRTNKNFYLSEASGGRILRIQVFWVGVLRYVADKKYRLEILHVA